MTTCPLCGERYEGTYVEHADSSDRHRRAIRIIADTHERAGCIEAPTSDQRYPRMRVEGRITYRHRLAYEEAHGPIPEGLTVDHLCFNKRCINPDHLEAVTRGENTHRAWIAGRQTRLHAAHPGVSACIRGHAPNWVRSGRSWMCRDCRNERMRAYRAKPLAHEPENLDLWTEGEKREAWGK